MADLTIKTDGLKPQSGSCVVPGVAGSAITLTTPAVTLDVDGEYDKTSGASGKCGGLMVSVENKTATAADNDVIGVLTSGPVGGFTGLTPGRLAYLSATAGKLADSGSVAVGYALTDEVLMFMPALASAAS